LHLKTIFLTSYAPALDAVLMNKKAAKKSIIQIQKIMPLKIQKQTGVDELSDSQLANLNAWLNLPKTRAVLGPGDPFK
jgi:hypothetical protein